jgi:hypothetical protein
MPRLVPKRAPDPVDEETDDSDHPPDWPHPHPHTRLRCLESFNYYSGTKLLARFIAGEYANTADPLVLQAWTENPRFFEAEHIS